MKRRFVIRCSSCECEQRLEFQCVVSINYFLMFSILDQEISDLKRCSNALIDVKNSVDRIFDDIYLKSLERIRWQSESFPLIETTG